jgi:hypothetical protein
LTITEDSLTKAGYEALSVGLAANTLLTELKLDYNPTLDDTATRVLCAGEFGLQSTTPTIYHPPLAIRSLLTITCNPISSSNGLSNCPSPPYRRALDEIEPQRALSSVLQVAVTKQTSKQIGIIVVQGSPALPHPPNPPHHSDQSTTVLLQHRAGGRWSPG